MAQLHFNAESNEGLRALPSSLLWSMGAIFRGYLTRTMFQRGGWTKMAEFFLAIPNPFRVKPRSFDRSEFMREVIQRTSTYSVSYFVSGSIAVDSRISEPSKASATASYLLSG